MATPPPVTAEVLRLEPATPLEPGAYRFSPLVSWLVATARPDVTVELGPGDEASLRSTCEAVLRSGGGASCVAVRLPSGSVTALEDFRSLLTELSSRLGPALRGYEDEEASLAGLGRGRPDSCTCRCSTPTTSRCPTWPPGARCWHPAQSWS